MIEVAYATSIVSGAGILPWLQVFLTPVVIVATAFVAWLVQRSILARRTVFDYIVNNELDDEWQKLREDALVRLSERPNKDDWSAIAIKQSNNQLSKEDLEYILPILNFLNRREFISIGLLNGSIHQATYANWWGVPFIYEWQHAKPFVQALRSTDKGDDKYFCKFEELATSQKFKKLSDWSDD